MAKESFTTMLETSSFDRDRILKKIFDDNPNIKDYGDFEDSFNSYFNGGLSNNANIDFGDINDSYSHLISTFIVNKNELKDIETKEILDEEDYISFFENVDMEKLIKEVSESSKRINNKLRSLDSQKRPVLLSGLMICLFTRENKNDFKDGYINWEPKTIITNIPTTINQILKDEGIPKDKIEVLTNELSFIKTDQDLNNTQILKEILEELDNNVIPLFSKETNYDILGKFYEEFLRYAGISNVKNGIVLTPNHVTKLFTELVEIKNNDVILDTCCGTGAFLISAMNKLFSEINSSNLRNKNELVKKIKQSQLIGFEKSSTMYALSISNMLFRGDGKSRIYNADSFSEESKEILDDLKKDGIIPSIGFINPPYGGQDNKDKPTKKEIQFLENMLDKVSRFGIIIAPLSTYIKEETIRERILSKHTLKYVINMPKELFQPNASTHTAIAVFETNKPHNNNEVIFYDLRDDGFILSKNRGRTDALNRWNNIKKKLLEELNDPDKFSDGIHLLKTKITEKDEWIIQAHSQTDYSGLNEGSFIKSIKEYTIFSTKLKLDLLDKDIDELTFSEILNENKISSEEKLKDLDIRKKIGKIKTDWFDIKSIFEVEKGERLVEIERVEGDIPLITASSKKNGIVDFLAKDVFKDKKKIFENKITIDMFFNVFYHNFEYFSDDNVHTLIPKFDADNLYKSLFLLTILKESGYKYAYGRQLRIKRLELEKIKLPIDKKGNPDWEFMEDYIKSLPYSSNL
jgi:type I restriction enzyme M protein